MVNTKLSLVLVSNTTGILIYYVCEYEGDLTPNHTRVLKWYDYYPNTGNSILITNTNSIIYYDGKITDMPWLQGTTKTIYLIFPDIIRSDKNPKTIPYGKYTSTLTETLTIKVLNGNNPKLKTPINLKFDYDYKNFNITQWYWVKGNELINLYTLLYSDYMGTYKDCVFTQYLFYAGDPSTPETLKLMENIFGLYNNTQVIYAEFNDLVESGYNTYGLVNSSTPAQSKKFVIEQITSQCFCFSHGTKILCLTQYLKEEYRLVQDLIIGDFVKSYLHGYRKVSKILNGSFVNNPNDQGVSNCMYKMIKTDDNKLIEDLTLTRNHGVLVEKLTENEEKNVDKNNLPVIDNLLTIITADSDKFEKVMDTNWYKYYHFSLETDGDEDRRFGVWANGILVEVPSNNMMDGALNIKPLDF